MPSLTVSFLLAIVPVLVAFGLRSAVIRHASGQGRTEQTIASSRGAMFGASLVLGGVGGVVFAVALQLPLPLALPEHRWAALFWDFVVAGPALEELGKGLVLMFLFGAGRVSSRVDGLILGIGAGVGFSALETMTAFLVSENEGNVEGWWTAAVIRVFFGATVHAGATGAMGMVLGHLQGWRTPWRGLTTLTIGYAVSWLIHASWNTLMLLGALSESVAPRAVALLIPAGILIIVLRSLHHDLSPEVPDSKADEVP
jgi:RsiW-degrading membrane proteinase PrsW (M82 family)